MMDLHRAVNEIMNRHESRQQAAWQHRSLDVDAENCLYDHGGHEDPNAHCLGQGINVSHRPINYTTAFCAVLLVLSAMAWMFR